jgi:hypothetical protein
MTAATYCGVFVAGIAVGLVGWRKSAAARRRFADRRQLYRLDRELDLRYVLSVIEEDRHP